MSLSASRRLLLPFAASVAAAAAVAIGAAAVPGLADQVRDQEWWLTSVHVTQSWAITRGGDVTVAVLDTGVDPKQPDLTGSVVTGPDYTHSSRKRGSVYWGVHGTEMASLIAGHGHGPAQADGIIGVAPRAKILSIRVILEERDPLRADTALVAKSPAAIAAGIRYAVRKGAQVIDLPLDPGAAYADDAPGAAAAAGGSAAERQAVRYALASGVVLVAPAGDDGRANGQTNFPAAYPGVISVGAFNKTFLKAPFSSHLPYVTLTAPGDGLIAASPLAGYVTVSSTAGASAEVAGMAALIRSRYPGLSPQQVSMALTKGTRFRHAGGARAGSGSGTADAAQALSIAATLKPAGHAGNGGVVPLPGDVQRPAHRSAGVVRDVVIGAAGIALLLCVVLAVRVSRQRKRARSKPSYPQPTRPLSLRVNRPSPRAAEADIRPASAGQPPRPQLAPVPKLETGKPARMTGGPPWEPARKPDSELPWQGPEPATPRNSGVPQPPPQPPPLRGLNGRMDPAWGGAPWPAAPAPPGLRSPYDPVYGQTAASAPGGAPPSGDSPSGVPSGGGQAGTAGPRDPGGFPLRLPPGAAEESGFWLSPQGGGRQADAMPPRQPAGSSPPLAAPYEPPQNGTPAGARPGQLPVRRPRPPAAPPGREGATGPIYVWNPAAQTDAFPAIGQGPRGAEPGPPWPSATPGYTEPTPPAGPAGPPLGAENQALPPIHPPDRGRYLEDDEDDRHL
ncbi:MAG: S8 family serine peptidase [Micromonosporaceae bacterium]